MIFVTGGAGFIGANFILEWIAQNGDPVINIDKLTYAGSLDTLESVGPEPWHKLVRGDICDSRLLASLLETHKPRAIVNFAAESHVDRSIHGPQEFIQTNIVGIFNLLEAARSYWSALPDKERSAFRFVHISTDEVYGSLDPADAPFAETAPYRPNSPYAASKAAADHLVRAWYHTYGMPVMTTNCSNNYGPYQFPEKLIPLTILNALGGKPLPIYGDGQQVRDWLYVGDHCAAIRRVLDIGRPGETYNIGGRNERPNIEVVRSICSILDEVRPLNDQKSYAEQIAFVTDRPGHDRRYAINADKIANQLSWLPKESFETGLRRTVQWYLDNTGWVESVTSGAYRAWVDKHYGVSSTGPIS